MIGVRCRFQKILFGVLGFLFTFGFLQSGGQAAEKSVFSLFLESHIALEGNEAVIGSAHERKPLHERYRDIFRGDYDLRGLLAYFPSGDEFDPQAKIVSVDPFSFFIPLRDGVLTVWVRPSPSREVTVIGWRLHPTLFEAVLDAVEDGGVHQEQDYLHLRYGALGIFSQSRLGLKLKPLQEDQYLLTTIDSNPAAESTSLYAHFWAALRTFSTKAEELNLWSLRKNEPSSHYTLGLMDLSFASLNPFQPFFEEERGRNWLVQMITFQNLTLHYPLKALGFRMATLHALVNRFIERVNRSAWEEEPISQSRTKTRPLYVLLQPNLKETHRHFLFSYRSLSSDVEEMLQVYEELNQLRQMLLQKFAGITYPEILKVEKDGFFYPFDMEETLFDEGDLREMIRAPNATQGDNLVKAIKRRIFKIDLRPKVNNIAVGILDRDGGLGAYEAAIAHTVRSMTYQITFIRLAERIQKVEMPKYLETLIPNLILDPTDRGILFVSPEAMRRGKMIVRILQKPLRGNPNLSLSSFLLERVYSPFYRQGRFARGLR